MSENKSLVFGEGSGFFLRCFISAQSLFCVPCNSSLLQVFFGLSLLVASPSLLFVEKSARLHLELLKGHYGSENAVWAWCQALVFHSSGRLTDEPWEAGGRLSLRVPLLWRHSWAEQDLLQTTTRETESIWFNRCPSRQAPEELAANPAMLEASSAAQPISDITDNLEVYVHTPIQRSRSREDMFCSCLPLKFFALTLQITI
nr:uncharacterized protein LOC123863282 isoform X1 [Mirounga angustirostris]